MTTGRRGQAILGAIGFLAMVVASTGCSERRTGIPQAAAVVEGVKIPAADTEALTDAYMNSKTSGPEEVQPRASVAKLVVRYQIRLAFLEELAKKKGIVADGPQSAFDEAADVIEPEKYQQIGMRKEDFARELRANRLFKKLAFEQYPDVSVSETAVREEYDQRAPGLDRNWKVTAQVARFSAQNTAAELSGRVRRGESFEQAASALGADRVGTVEIDPIGRPFSPSTLDAIAALKPAQISDPIASANYWLVVVVQRREDLPKVTFEDVRPELEKIVSDKQRTALFQKWFEKEFAAADITVDRHYGKWNSKLANVT